MDLMRRSQGAIAPTAVLFTALSLIFTLSYMTKAVTQHRLEKFRFARKLAIYIAEAGLNQEAFDHIAFISTNDTTLIGPGGKDFPDRTNEPALGRYKNVEIFTPPISDYTGRAEYHAKSTGVVTIKNQRGEVEVERTVSSYFVPQGFEEYMYFTDKEESSGPPNSDWNGNVNFGAGDSLEGRIHTNGQISLSNFGCPNFSGRVTLGDQNGGINSWGACDEDVFLNDDGVSILDTVKHIKFPPVNTTNVLKANATRVYEADTKIYNDASQTYRDTMIMTEIEFLDNKRYRVRQWWYQVPPISGVVKFPYTWDLTSPSTTVEFGGVHLYDPVLDVNIQYDPTLVPPDDIPVGYGGPPWPQIVMSVMTDDDVDITDFIEDEIENNETILIRSVDNPSKAMFGTIFVKIPEGADRYRFLLSAFSFTDPTNTGFEEDEVLEIIFPQISDGLADIDFNAFEYWHDHPDDGTSYCRPDGFHHFDFPGITGDPFYRVMPWTEFYTNRPEVIYVRGGQVLVKGIVDGRFTVVTDDYIEYIPTTKPDTYDRVWGNIWLMDDLIYNDSNPITGEINESTENVIGLVAGGNVIVANTGPNGARNSLFGSNIVVNAAIMAMHEAFLTHYWQNTINRAGGPCTECSQPDFDDPYNSLGDGRGVNRNPYLNEGSQHSSTGNQDYRGYIRLWGSIVQQKRGYVKRNNPGPYTSGDIGYDKSYHYDWHLLDYPPPFFPVIENEDGSSNLVIKGYGEIK